MNARSSLATANTQPTRLLLLLSFAVPFLTLTLYWFCFIRAGYFPSRDEFPVLVASARMFHPSIASWFLEGYSRYFLSYPGLSHPATDFIRPGANLFYYLGSVLFGDHWGLYLLLTYAVQAGLVCLCVKLAIEALKLPAQLAFAVGLIIFISPSFGWEQIFIPSFTIDLLGAFCVIFALHELWHRRFFTAWLLLTAGVFTKETTLFAPVMTAFAVWLPTQKPASIARRLGYSLLWITPVLIWALLRRLVFHGDAGIYVLQNMALSGKLLNVLHGFLAWPFGTRNAQQSVQFRLLYFPLNSLFWITGTWAALRIARTRRQPAPYEFNALLFFCAGATAMPVLLNLPQRFGASLYPLFFLLLAAVAYATPDKLVRRWAAACLILSASVSVFQKIADPLTLHESRGEWALARSYIHSIHNSHAKYLLLVDDATGGFDAPNLVARFAGYPGTLMRSNNIEGLSLKDCAAQPIVVRAHNQSILSTLTPPCGYYAFDSLSTRDLLHATDGLIFHADDQVSVRIVPPAAQPLPRSGIPQMFGTLTVEIAGHPKETSVLIPDLRELRYKELP